MTIISGTASLTLTDHGECIGIADLQSSLTADALDVMSEAVRVARGRPIFFAVDPSQFNYQRARAFYERVGATFLGVETHDNNELEVWMYL